MWGNTERKTAIAAVGGESTRARAKRTFKDLRKEAGFSTVEKLSDCISASRGAVAKWELGYTTPHAFAVPIIAKALNVTTDELIAALMESKKLYEGIGHNEH